MGLNLNLVEVVQAVWPSKPVDKQFEQQPLSTIQVTGITTDTREIQPGYVFVALRGQTYDGHSFVEAAAAEGAAAAIVDQDLPPQSVPLLRVPDTLMAYQALGHWWRERLGLSIVAVTGSVGKTTTKELIAAALATQGRVGKTRANYNNEIGVPKTLLEFTPDHRFGVVEMGMRGAGEIALLARIARPDIAVITNVGTAHIGRLGSEQAIADAKCELLAELAPNGIAILNHDCSRLISTAAGVWSGRVITYGLEGGDVQGRLIDDQTIDVEGIRLPLPLPGQHNALNYLAAVAVMKALGLDWTQLQTGLMVNLPAGRTRQIELPGDIVLLDETYNAGLESMLAALELLAKLPGKRRLAVLGTMKELGDHSIRLHRQVGEQVKHLGIDGLFILADPDAAEAMVTGASSVPIQQFDDHDRLIRALQEELQPGDRLLLKASRSVALDRVVAGLQAAPQDVRDM